MRLIERQMIDAIKQGKDWRKDDTKVVHFYMVTRLPRLMQQLLKSMMVVGNQLQLNHDSMHSSMGCVMVTIKASIRRSLNGLFRMTKMALV